VASTDIREFYQIWTQDGADARMLQSKILDQSFERVIERKSPLFALMKKSGNRKNPVWEWGRGWGFQNTLTATLASTTLTFSGYLLGSAITEDNLKSHVRKNMLLMRESDGLQVKVTAMDSTAYTGLYCTVAAHGNTGALSNDTAATTYRIVGIASSDYDDTYVPQSLPRDILRCSSQIWKAYLEIPHSRRDLSMEFVANEFKDNYDQLIYSLHNQIATTALVGKPVYSGGAYKHALNTENPTMTGLFGWADIAQEELANTLTYVDMDQEAAGVDSLNLLVHNMQETELVDFNRGNWIIGCHPVSHQYLSDEFLGQREWSFKETEAGYEVTAFKSKIGKTFKISADTYCPRGKLFIADMTDFEWCYYGQQGIRNVKLSEGKENVDQHKITFQAMGVKCTRPRHVGVMYDLPTTYSTS
jgi:hypothetical protein